MYHLPNLRYLNLDHNRIEEIPNFCDVNNESYIPKLNNLILNKNYVAQIHIQTFIERKINIGQQVHLKSNKYI
jgi:Leucine-rich repeat (LRR) protein